ncbi:MAG TPA: squalene synthase HpnC [Tepidisphaeraceae bacterium]|jgi:squalene synthase HpnC|nr:squalene synthase HpnC [Tepidisphaeraceae bacterium]
MTFKAQDMAEGERSGTEGADRSRPLPPMVVEALAPAKSVEEAEAFCTRLAKSHYENFSVVSVLLPAHLRQDFSNVYAFCRTADDLGDEIHNPDVAMSHLENLAEQTRKCFAGEVESTLFAALSGTIARHEIPIDPFLDLIDAFEQDQRIKRYETFDQLLNYCRRSANPVGRIVLYLCGYRDERRQQLSDLICTALQLANFWQDVRRDLVELDRIYLPAESMRKFGVNEELLARGECNQPYRDLIRFEVDRTTEMFDRGDELFETLDPSVRGHIALFSKGGRAILQAIREADYDTLSARPALSAWQKGRLVLSAVGAKLGSMSA